MRSVASVCVCLFVRALTGERLELSTPNLTHVYSIAVSRHVCSVLPAAVAGVGLHVDTTAYVGGGETFYMTVKRNKCLKYTERLPSGHP